MPGEFILTDWKNAGLNVASAIKRGLFTIKDSLVRVSVGKLNNADAEKLEQSLRGWLDLPD